MINDKMYLVELISGGRVVKKYGCDRWSKQFDHFLTLENVDEYGEMGKTASYREIYVPVHMAVINYVEIMINDK